MVKVEKISPQQAQSQLQLLNAIAMMIIITKGKKQSTSNKWHYDKTFALFMQPGHSPDLVFQVVVLLSLSGTDFTNDSYWLCG